MRRSVQFVEPDQSDASSPVLFPKIFPFPPDPNQIYKPRRLVPLEGRIAIVTDAGRDAVDAAALGARGDGRAGPHGPVSDQWRADERCLLRTAKSCGPDASTPASSLRRFCEPDRADKTIFADDGDKQARSPGRARNKPLKPLRRECRVIRGTCGDDTRVLHYTLHTRLRVQRAPGIPHALYARGQDVSSKLARRRGEIAKLRPRTAPRQHN